MFQNVSTIPAIAQQYNNSNSMGQTNKNDNLRTMGLQDWLDALHLKADDIVDEMHGPSRATIYNILSGKPISKQTAWKAFALLKAHSAELMVERQVFEFARFGTDKLKLPSTQEAGEETNNSE